jgi:alkylation response protein AidB-like acyl-CoA dehydrogenase
VTVADETIRRYGDAEAQALVAQAIEMAPVIRGYGDQIERERKLPPELVAQMNDAGFFHALLPRDLGGREADPVTSARIVEEVSKADASAGWCVMLMAQQCGFAGFIPAEDARLIYGNGGLIAGTARPIGRAVAVDGGYDVSGRWPFASGSTHATWFAAECVIYDGESKRLDEQGNEKTKMLFVPASDVTIHDTWDTIGLRGTASNDFSIEHAFVPETRGFQVIVDKPVHPWPLFRAEPLAFINHGAQAIGVARAAIETAIDTSAKKDGWGGVKVKDLPRMQSTIAEASALVGSAANYLYETSWALWQQALEGDMDPALRGTVRLATSHAAKAAVQAVDMLYASLATAAVQSSSPLSKQFRDIHTASAHVMIGTMTWEAAGRVLMGMEPQFPFF